MRLVVDTNVFISAALKHASLPAEVVRWVDRQGGLLKSSATERELFTVLARPRLRARIPPPFAAEMRRMFDAAELIEIVDMVVACRDPEDDKFLELAVNGRADAIVSGDGDLLALAVFRAIPIIDSATFARSRMP